MVFPGLTRYLVREQGIFLSHQSRFNLFLTLSYDIVDSLSYICHRLQINGGLQIPLTIGVFELVGIKAKRKRISKRVFQENQARQIFRKTDISYPLIRARTCAYQEVRNVCFSENLAYLVFLKHRFEIRPFGLLPTNYKFLAHQFSWLYLAELCDSISQIDSRYTNSQLYNRVSCSSLIYYLARLRATTSAVKGGEFQRHILGPCQRYIMRGFL